MKTRLLNAWDRLRGSFWFLPGFLVSAAAGLGFLLPHIDNRYSAEWAIPWWLSTTPEGARTVLSAIAGAMITVAGVVFSVTMVTLSIASSQFGSRVLRRTMRNRVTQLAIGVFLGTSVFCLLVLRTVQGTDHAIFVPHLSVTLGIVLSVISVFVLIYFIHDVAAGIQAPHVVARLAADLNASIDRLYPDKIGLNDCLKQNDADEETLPELARQPDGIVESAREGYLQAIDGDSLLEAARRRDLLIELCVRPGDFVTAGDPVARLWGGPDLSERDAEDLVNGALIVANMRTPRQDVNCAIHELAQLTVRALSTGINDPFTAINGIDRLSAALGRLAERKLPSKYRADEQGRTRLIMDRVAFPEALAAALSQIRQNAQDAPPVGIRLLEGLARIARKAQREVDCKAVLQHATMVLRTFRNAGHLDSDFAVIERQFDEVRSILGERGVTDPPDIRDGAQTRERDRGNHRAGEGGSSSRLPAEREVNG